MTATPTDAALVEEIARVLFRVDHPGFKLGEEHGGVQDDYRRRAHAILPLIARERADEREKAAAYHDAKARKGRKEAARHTRAGGYRSDCEQDDLKRAVDHEKHAAAIRSQEPTNG